MNAVWRWAQATIEWAQGDPMKGNLIVGSPLAVALALRGIVTWWFGRPGWLEDLDEAVAFAEQSAEPLTLAQAVSWNYGCGIFNGVLRADDAAVRTIEAALRTAEASGNNYAVGHVNFVLGCVLWLRAAEGDRQRGLELLSQVRDMCMHQRFPLSELPIIDLYAGRELANSGDRDGAIGVIRKSLDDLFTHGQTAYCVAATGVLVETLLERGAESDVAEAEAAIARLAAAPAEGSVIRDVWLLRLRALLARARGDENGYLDCRDRYRALATSLGFEGHVAWAEVMP